ncbi:MAG TPA: 2-hydroxychromene-2-carboxylate isomerase [Candidatus Lambdaproteobacteria bacterium]|nr:2-hydroxychromene-2-carboxylate isomerase [Candidatus Lambdaproteobacteria bacterium]HIO83570.1 2-hydroxychromene-2-carboxylate isomerase [Deltaproteobacteria bacterium]
MNIATWYFDFVSPFAYLQNLRLEEFSSHIKIDRKPLLFAGLLKHWDSKGPAELPPKRLFTYRHVQWMADRLDIPLRFPDRHPFNPIPLLRLCIAAGCSKKAVDSIFKCIWEEGLVFDDPDHWNTFCNAVGLSVFEANELISKPEIKSELITNGENAIKRAVFGVPTLIVDGQLFWGYDSTSLVLDYLTNPGLFNSPAMKRLETLPDKE